MIAAGGPAGKTRSTLAGMDTVRPAPSVTLAARAGNGATSEAERPVISVRRSSRIFGPAPVSQLLQQGVAAGYVDFAGGLLDIEFLHHAVFDQHRIASGAHAKTVAGAVEGEIDRLGEVAIAVGQEVELFGCAGFLPGIHDEHIIHT